ncbi:hypothetical protein SAMN04488002_1434 [Litoreibacter janthinus]|uniref:Uncharacterized protein n=1 Tax=Litoreibacter janthinus TaxID=670154 RepID=A0A1I6GGI7_9RHOB|nr:hypothetical protein SAMN04488002_1434 [Litoreibacter janthinus]
MYSRDRNIVALTVLLGLVLWIAAPSLVDSSRYGTLFLLYIPFGTCWVLYHEIKFRFMS